MYSEEVRAAIGKYAAHHGPAATARHFTRQLRWNVCESTVRKFRDLYKVELQCQAATSMHHEPIAVTTLPPRQHGRSLMIGDLDGVVQDYIIKLQAAGGIVMTHVVEAAAKGILQACARSLLTFHLNWLSTGIKQLSR